MKSTARLCLGLMGVSALLALVSCSDDDDDVTGGAGQGNEGGADTSPGPTEGGSSGNPSHAGGEAHGGAGHVDAPVICQVLGHLCHDADNGSGPAADCHDLGHEGDGDACEQGFASCIGTCVDTGGGAGGAGGAAGSQQDPYCAALGSLCHAVDAGTGMGAECHDLGHVGNAADCAESFDSCATFCLAELEKLEAAAGGAGGTGAGGAAGPGGVGGVD